MTRQEARRSREATLRIAKALRQIAADIPFLSARRADLVYNWLEQEPDTHSRPPVYPEQIVGLARSLEEYDPNE